MPEINVIPTVSDASPLDAYKRKILAAQLMQRQASDGSQPIYNPKAGWAKVLQGIAGGASEGMAERDEAGKQKATADLISQYLSGGATPSAPADASAPAQGPATPSAAASPMGALPGMIPPMPKRIYDQNEMNPLDAAVATPQELSVGVNAPAKYAALLGKTAIDNDIPANVLAAQTKQESGFNPNAVSSAGAQGISQFMPGTAKEMGINPLDPNQAIPAQGQYLRQQLDKFGGSMPLALAAYNAGPGRVANSGGDISRLPAETQGYVKSITGAAGAPPDRASVMAQQLSPQPGTAVSDRQRALASQLIADPRTPPAVKAAIIGQMMPKAPIKLGEGDSLIDPTTYKPLATGGGKKTNDVKNFEYYQSKGGTLGFNEFVQQSAAANGGGLGLNPQYGVDDQGNPVLLQLGKDGHVVRSQMPDGVKLSKQPIKMDAGTHFVLLDPVTRQIVGSVPKDLAGAEREKGVGEAQGKAVASAPADIQSGQNALDIIQKIRTNPYLGRGTGATSLLNKIPGTGGYDFQNLVDQAKSGAFLQAIQQMRGLGSLSNAEGGAATAAVNRINTATSEEAFLAGLADYETIVKQGIARAQGRLANPSSTNPAQIPQGKTSTGVSWSIE